MPLTNPPVLSWPVELRDVAEQQDSDMKPHWFIPTFLFCLAAGGCATSMLEERVITQFVDALDEENESALRRVSSSNFEEKTLRSDNVFGDLEIVEMPAGEVKILEIEEPSKDRRSVRVEDSSGVRYQFELSRNSEDTWEVDDILVRQEKRLRKVRMNVTRPATQVMDLVFSVREYMDLWAKAQTEQILERSSPELTESLQTVPPAWLAAISTDIVERYDPSLAKKPEAQLTDKSAVVRMSVTGGYLLVKATQYNGRWLVDDVEVHRRSESGHPGSIRRQADAVGGLGRFLTAYGTGENSELSNVSSPDFYKGTLQFARLDLVDLPPVDAAPQELKIRSFSGRVTIMVQTERDVVRFDLVDPGLEEQKQVARTNQKRNFLVDDVILYDRTRQNERTLASVFTAPSRAALFLKALRNGDLQTLQRLSSLELNQSVWNHMSPDVLDSVTIPLNELQNLTAAESVVHGSRTELHFTTVSGGSLRCLMNEESGKILMTDIQFISADSVTMSMRKQLELQLPVLAFAKSWKNRDLEGLKHHSSAELKRYVLTRLQDVPDTSLRVAERLDTMLLAARVTQRRATLDMGLPSGTMATVHLVQEHDRWMVNDVSIPESDSMTVQLKKELRAIVAGSLLARSHPSDGPTELIPVPPPAALESVDPPAREVVADVPGVVNPLSVGPRTVPGIRQVEGVRNDEAGSRVNLAQFETFGPDADAVARRLNQQEAAMKSDPVSPPTKQLQSAPGTPLRRVPKSATENDVTDELDGALRFGPRFSQRAVGQTASDVSKPTDRLADRPVAID